ncbi:hypothetical protein [uncultured Tateyamaria sp.]|uniref:hypothetical protein n=1 Tax=uncultured Tateyamaria sp. TaxID=455651 RepID=UPI002619EEBD|nr:hypothetical protein [uncultured Tateyamaria sp.]
MPPATAIAIPTARGLWLLMAITVIAALLVSLPNLRDPMLRYDDFPALLADPSGFWPKTLHEGRWLNYLWHLREVVTPAWLNFVVYQALWAGFAASIAFAATGAARHGPILALLILVAPPATLISLWFNTLMPGLALVTVYGLLGCVLRPRTHRLLMPIFVVASFMSYTTYPLLILAMALICSPEKSVRDLAGLLGVFVASFAAAVLIVYTINYQVHGIFGVPLAAWRAASPASDIAGMIQNIPLVTQSLSDLMIKASFSFAPAVWFHLAMLVGGTLVLARHVPKEALYLHAGLWMGMALVVVQILKMGAIVPARSFLFAWIIYAVIIVRAAQVLSVTPNLAARLVLNFVLLVVGSYLLQTFVQYTTYRGWQAETRALAPAVKAVEGPVEIAGDVMQYPSAQLAGVQDPTALVFRLHYLTGKTVTLCAPDASCSDTALHLDQN